MRKIFLSMILVFCFFSVQLIIAGEKAETTEMETNCLPTIVLPPFNLREQVVINVLDAYPCSGTNIIPANSGNDELWRKVSVGNSVMKSTSWKFSKNTHCVFYRFMIDSTHKLPERLLLVLEQSAFETTIYVDGNVISMFTEGFLPLETDITEAVVSPGLHEVLIRVRDHYACRNATGHPLVPLGAMFKYTKGIIMPPRLVALNKVFLKDPFVRSDIKSEIISADIGLVAENVYNKDMRLEIRLLDSVTSQPVITSDKIVELHGGDEQRISFTLNVGDKLKLWDIGKPNLYIAEFRLLKASQVIDEIRVTFGYRTVDIHGEDIFLNDRKIRLLGPWAHIGEWTWAPRKLKGADKTYKGLYRLLLKRGMNYGRLHAQVYNRKFYDAADEVGFLLVAESSLAHRPISNTSLIHLRNMVKYLRNHPSIIILHGPRIKRLQNASIIIGRNWDEPGRRNLRTDIHILQDDNVLCFVRSLPSGGDTSYASWLDIDKESALISYYSAHQYCMDSPVGVSSGNDPAAPEHNSGADIYLAHISYR